MKPTPSPHDQEQDQEIIELLERLESFKGEYPPELLAARRADFIAKVKQHNPGEIREKARASKQFTNRLRELQSVKAEYPAELLAARRAAFIAQVEGHSPAEVREELAEPDPQLIHLFKSLKAEKVEYPQNLLAARRAALVRQVARGGRISWLDEWRASIERLFREGIKVPSLRMPDVMRTSVVVALLMLAAYVGSLFRSAQPLYQAAPQPGGAAQSVPIRATGTEEVPEVICKPGYLPPLCLAQEADKDGSLTFQGNGVARPAVAKDTLPGYSGIHDADFLNDGRYGPGSSWISNSAYSWIKIDLGKPTTINTVAFGRDRLGHLKDGNPGQFVIAVAMNDNVYADGNSSNDYTEYIQVYDSNQDGFSGVVAGPETVQATFGPVTARFVKITFANAGTAVDEVEVFMVQPAILAENPTRKPKDDEPASVPASAVPSRTPFPVSTATPIPVDTLVPTDTPTTRPTNTPTDVPTDVPTDTPTPRPTRTPLPPTDTSTPRPTRTPTPEPTNTPLPTDTPEPTNTPPEPTNTPVPPSDTPVLGPTDTAEPFVEPTETPMFIILP